MFFTFSQNGRNGSSIRRRVVYNDSLVSRCDTGQYTRQCQYTCQDTGYRPYVAQVAPGGSSNPGLRLKNLAAIPSRHNITQSKPYTMVTPEEMAPFPKAPLRKKGNRGRKLGRTVLEPGRAKKQKVANDKAQSKKKKKAIAKKSCLTAVLWIIMNILTLAVKILAMQDY
ncbi:hypothetical protein J6590_093609 [Homalodisca vitripennis]|nr:hypothetical protein J6590_093609 [Homalodisca vitripennis]